jgi:hypothetical protein
MSDSPISKAFKAANRIDREELMTYPVGVLKQVRGLLKRALRSGSGIWDEPFDCVDSIIKEMEVI